MDNFLVKKILIALILTSPLSHNLKNTFRDEI